MWLIKVKESQQFQFFASYAIDIHANEFQPTIKGAFICTLALRWAIKDNLSSGFLIGCSEIIGGPIKLLKPPRGPNN